MIKGSAKYLVSHRTLLRRVTISELRRRHAGSMLGLAWGLVAPWLMLAVYAVVYLFIFKVNLTTPDGFTLSRAQYLVFLFSGLVPYLMTAEALSSAVLSVVANKAVLENTVFPIDLAPPKAVVLSQLPMIAGLPVVLLAGAALGLSSWTYVLLPVLWLLHVMALVGIAWFLSLANVVLRDLQYIISIVLMVLIIASPLAWTVEMVPKSLRLLVWANPLAYYILAYQDILVFGRVPRLSVVLFVVAWSTGVFLAGSRFFGRVKCVMIDYV